MKEWCMEHPYMTFMLGTMTIASFTSLGTQVISLFRRPPPPPVVNMKLNIPESTGDRLETGDATIN